MSATTSHSRPDRLRTCFVEGDDDLLKRLDPLGDFQADQAFDKAFLVGPGERAAACQ
ncbi:hypothetical protein AB0K68_36220 [Streptomyces sp. NPDC050698]